MLCSDVYVRFFPSKTRCASDEFPNWIHSSRKGTKLVVCGISRFIRKYKQRRASQNAPPSTVRQLLERMMSSMLRLIDLRCRLSLYVTAQVLCWVLPSWRDSRTSGRVPVYPLVKKTSLPLVETGRAVPSRQKIQYMPSARTSSQEKRSFHFLSAKFRQHSTSPLFWDVRVGPWVDDDDDAIAPESVRCPGISLAFFGGMMPLLVGSDKLRAARSRSVCTRA